MVNNILGFCDISSSVSVQNFYDCFQNITINGSLMVAKTRKFNYQDYTFDNTSHSTWNSVWSFYFGHCVTSDDIDSLKDGQFLKIYLNKSLDYSIWIHDPDFFYISLNPRSIPNLEISYSPVYYTVLQYIEQEKHSKLHREKVRKHMHSIAKKQL